MIIIDPNPVLGPVSQILYNSDEELQCARLIMYAIVCNHLNEGYGSIWIE